MTQRRRDFTLTDEPVVAVIGGDEYTAPPSIAPIILGELSEVAAGISVPTSDQGAKKMGETLNRIADVFDLLLDDEPAKRFRQRLLARKNALDLTKQVIPIMHWLLECYGLRPTGPSSPSANGSGDGNGGTFSTDGAQPETSTLLPFPPTDSST